MVCVLLLSSEDTDILSSPSDTVTVSKRRANLGKIYFSSCVSPEGGHWQHLPKRKQEGKSNGLSDLCHTVSSKHV